MFIPNYEIRDSRYLHDSYKTCLHDYVYDDYEKHDCQKDYDLMNEDSMRFQDDYKF